MRPFSLDPFFAPLSSLPGVGPRLAVLLDKLLGEPGRPARILDLLFHLPHAGVDRAVRGLIVEAPTGVPVTVAATVTGHRFSASGTLRAPSRVIVEDITGDITLVFFRMPRARLEKMLPLGSSKLISGTLELWDGRRQMVHPDRIVEAGAAAALPSVEPVYGLTEGVSLRLVGRTVEAALDRVSSLPEWQDPALLAREGWPSLTQALHTVHRPANAEELAPEVLAKSPARRRLAYDELFATQLALGLVRARSRRARGRSHAGDGTLINRIKTALPFALTASQAKAVTDIQADLARETRMLRLLQGDVGSGKTVVGLLAMAAVAEAGRQSALMAPTELLAHQHYKRIAPLAEAAGLKTVMLTGRDTARTRAKTLEVLGSGEVTFAVGTHALFQETVVFKDLGLVVIDEQHRFGVHQRLSLGAKGEGVDMLVMTATPIPRTLALSTFGDMDISVLTEKPAGRQPIATRAVSLSRLDEVVGSLPRALEGGARVYWICPLVGESESLDLAAAQERYDTLTSLFGGTVGLLHGKMKAREKDAAMDRFARGETGVLVATTVVEVGVDVPEATIMVIEHAERFGLAQLHQLRGRIGRGRDASTCILLYKSPLGQTAKARLEILRQTEDGFRIAEEDLRLRGQGEMLGLRQSGTPAFRLAREDVDADLISIARDDARLVIEKDPDLQSPRGEALRVLLYLFERDAAVRLLSAG